LSINSLSAQQTNVLLLGKIEQAIPNQTVKIEIDKRYVNNSVEEYTTLLNPNNEFGVACRIEIPQLITLHYGKQSCQLFVEPNDTLTIQFNGLDFPANLYFSGKGKRNNNFWQQFVQQYPTDPVIFNYNQYRKGIYYYKIHQNLDKNLRALAPTDFLDWQKQKNIAKKNMFDMILPATTEEDYTPPFTNAFRAFMTAEITFRAKLEYLAYSHVYGARHQIDSSFLLAIESDWQQDDAYLGNFYYREFLMAWLNYKNKADINATKSPYISQYYLAEETLQERTKYFVMARMLALALRKNPPKIVKDTYEHFLKENPYYELDRLVLDPFQKASSHQTGRPAPEFSLKNVAGKTVALSQFKGKVVYLDFWASWCRPCIKKQTSMQTFEPKFDTSEVVFVHVSLDKNFDNWKEQVTQQQLKGVHLFYDHNTSRIVQDYEVFSVPKFFLITHTGNFAYTPSSYDLEELSVAIRRLVNR
jgi:peroxiredoxin